MSEEGRTAPAQKARDPGEPMPELGPPSSVTEVLEAPEAKKTPATSLAPVAGISVDEGGAITIPVSGRDPATAARRRTRMPLRIPDDEITRPLARTPSAGVRASSSAPSAVSAGPRVPPAPTTAPPVPFRPSADSFPADSDWPEPSNVEVPISEDPLEAANPVFAFAEPPPAEPAVVAVLPMRIIAIEPPSKPEGFDDEDDEPLPEPSPPPLIMVLEEHEEEVRFDEEPAAPKSEPGSDEISVEEVVEEAPKAPELPPTRPRAMSTPLVPPPTTGPVPTTTVVGPFVVPVVPASVVSPAAPAGPPSKPALIIVPPRVGTVAPPRSSDSGLRRKGRLWWEELFNDDYLRTCEKLTDEQILREVNFIEDRLSVELGGSLLDLGCGTGRHAIELAQRGYEVVGFDLSLAMLARAGDEAQEREVRINFVQGDMREMTFDEQFDGVYCWGTSFGYFDEEKNALVVERVRRALRPGGLLLLDVVNRDFLVRQTPSLAWFEGEGCICMDEMNVDFITSRMKVKRTMMLDDGGSREIEYSMRVYSLHELGKILHEQGFKVCEVSGRPATPGVFFGNESPRTIVLAEKR